MSHHLHTDSAVPPLDPFSWKLTKTEDEIRQLSQACRLVDGCRNLDDGLLLAALDGKASAWTDQNTTAYLAVSDQGRLELLVHPKLRGQGLGTQLLERGLERLKEIQTLKGVQTSQGLQELQGLQSVQGLLATVWAYGDKAPTVAWLERHGFTSERVLYQLQREPSAQHPVEFDPGWNLRPFTPKDTTAWHDLHVSLQTDPSRAWTLEALERQLRRPETPASDFWLLWQGETLRGYLWLKGSEIFLFAIDPAVRGQGLGGKLLAFGLSKTDGVASVFCDDQRAAALGLYKKYGFQEVARDRCLRRSLTV